MPKLFGKDTINVIINKVQALILFLFLFPLFFQLSGSIFTETDLIYNSQGKILLIPIPLASVFCLIGVSFLLRLEKRHFGMGVVFSVFILMMLSTIISTGGTGKTELAKFILLVQFVFPLFALVLGGLYLKPKSNYLSFEAVILYMLLLVIPLEVIATILQDTGVLTPYLYFFSLYQHLEYLPVIFIGLYFLAVTSFYEKSRLRYLVLFMAPWMGIYLAASFSILAIILAIFASFISMFFLNKNNTGHIASIVLLLLISFIIYSSVIQEIKVSSKEITAVTSEYDQDENYKNKVSTALQNSLKERSYYWEFYVNGVFESTEIFLFGHQSRPDRSRYPSAYNYYLDLIYNFGAVAMLPIIYLIFITMRNCRHVIKAGSLTPNLTMLMFVVVFFVFVDSLFKVSFRQPYAGMIMFFLWGRLLTQLSRFDQSLNIKISR